MRDTQQLYDAYHEQCLFPDFGRDTFHGERALAAYPDASATLDFGCGNGFAVRRMRELGHPWFGLEYSQAAYDQYLGEPFFFVGDLSQFGDRRFDLVYSTEVLEHIPVPEVQDVIRNLCRVTDRYMFLTISLRPSSDDNRYHCTLRSRTWWQARFAEHGFQPDRPVIERFQRVTLKSTRRILSRWAHLGPECRALADNPPYELFGETQFWYFAFRRQGVPEPPRALGAQPLLRRKVVPALRHLLRLDPPRGGLDG
jgi:SAM-dependent methyltransferase